MWDGGASVRENVFRVAGAARAWEEGKRSVSSGNATDPLLRNARGK